MNRTFAIALAALALGWTVSPRAQELPTSQRIAGPDAAVLPPEQAAGARLYTAKCGLCHVGFAPGTIMLGRRLGEDHKLLSERHNLTAPYISAVVRHGLRGMPAITRVDLSDEDLARITAYLTRKTPPAGAGQ